MDESVCIPIELAELLHATLGPLGDVLESEGHGWSPLVKKVLAEYERARDNHVGEAGWRAVDGATIRAVDRVTRLGCAALEEEEDFLRWDAEVGAKDSARESETDPA